MPGRSFSEILDAALGSLVTGGIPPATGASLAFSSPHPLFFFRLHAPAGLTPVTAVVQESRPASESAFTTMFTADERRALDVLLGLGATLRPDFTASELRRQYRLLARRLHPDRHPAARADERARLSRAFAAATDSYRLLSAVVIAH